MTYSSASDYADNNFPKFGFNSFEDWYDTVVEVYEWQYMKDEQEFEDRMKEHWLDEVGVLDRREEQLEAGEQQQLVEPEPDQQAIEELEEEKQQSRDQLYKDAIQYKPEPVVKSQVQSLFKPSLPLLLKTSPKLPSPQATPALGTKVIPALPFGQPSLKVPTKIIKTGTVANIQRTIVKVGATIARGFKSLFRI